LEQVEEVHLDIMIHHPQDLYLQLV